MLEISYIIVMEINNMKHEIEINEITVKLNFNADGFNFKCELQLEKNYGSVKLRNKENKEFDLSIYKHINDMIFCVMDTPDDERYNERASFWHSVGNLFDKSSFSQKEALNETIDVIKTVCLDQYRLFTEGK